MAEHLGFLVGQLTDPDYDPFKLAYYTKAAIIMRRQLSPGACSRRRNFIGAPPNISVGNDRTGP
jgi:hypothetical protein